MKVIVIGSGRKKIRKIKTLLRKIQELEKVNAQLQAKYDKTNQDLDALIAQQATSDQAVGEAFDSLDAKITGALNQPAP